MKMKQSGFSFEAGGRTFPSVVFHSMSGTLMLKFEGFFIFCYYYHFFLLKPLINLLPFPLPVPLPTVQFHFFFQNLKELQPCLGMTDSWVPETLETVFLSILLKKFPWEACPQILLDSSYLRRSDIYPELRKTVENPEQ